MTLLNQLLARKTFLALVSVLLCLVCVFLFFKVYAGSYNKTQPYEVNVVVKGVAENHVFFAYDYGGGIQDQHIRRLDLETAVQEFNFSVSAWKHVHSVYVFSPKISPFSIESFSIHKNGVSTEPNLPKLGPTLEGANWFYRFSLAGFDYRNE